MCVCVCVCVFVILCLTDSGGLYIIMIKWKT